MKSDLMATFFIYCIGVSFLAADILGNAFSKGQSRGCFYPTNVPNLRHVLSLEPQKRVSCASARFLSLSSRKARRQEIPARHPARVRCSNPNSINHALRELTTTRIHLFDFHIRRTQPDDVVR